MAARPRLKSGDQGLLAAAGAVIGCMITKGST